MDARRRFLDDLSKLATSAVGVVQGAGREAEELMRQRFERVFDRMDLVTRDEFEAVQAMAQAAREENERLAARIEALEEAGRRPKARKATAAKGGKSGTKAGARPAGTNSRARRPRRQG